ncbi:MAG: hypothetical protein GY775_04315 [Candidatus Scalindua sp.]|nr:hypothetical protein [Candidatus Scalindua sp.]
MKKLFLMPIISGLFLSAPSILFAGECKEHITLLSAAELAKEYDQSEMWVLQNVKIKLWSKQTSQGKGKVVGKMYPGSRALLLKKGKDDYQVKSPLDKSIGWMNMMQVGKTLWQGTETREACKNNE